MKRLRKFSSVFLIFTLLQWNSVSLPSHAAKVTPGTTCKKAGNQEIYKSKIFTCIKLGKKLYWDNGKKFKVVSQSIPTPSANTGAAPAPTPSSTISKPPAPTPSQTIQASKAENTDLQFIYGTTDSCGNQIGFMRIGSDGNLKRNKLIVKGDSKYNVTPLDYESDDLLFKTESCSSTGSTGQISTLWRLNLGNPNSRPQQVYSLMYRGTRDGLIIDAKIDIASGKTLVFAWINGDQQIFTAESNPLLIWSLQRQGWLSAGIYGTAFEASTGWSLSVYGYNSSTASWRSVYVDWRTEIQGIGKVTPRGYGTNAQFQGKGSVATVRTGILKMPYIYSTSQGVYVCVDFPTTSGPIIDVDTNSRCTRISGKQLGDIGTSYAKGDGTSGTWQAVIAPNDNKAYIFKSGPIFGTWDPVQIQKTIDISSALANQRNIFEVLSTYEITWDIGEVSPTLTYSGYFSNA